MPESADTCLALTPISALNGRTKILWIVTFY